MANFKRKRPKEHTLYMCGMKCRYDKIRMTGNHPRMRSIRDRKIIYTFDERLQEYNVVDYNSQWV